MTDEERFVQQLPTIERVISSLCRRYQLERVDAEDFASSVKLKLIEDEYLILRTFEGRSSFASFIFVVARRMLLDQRDHDWGKWRPSAEAKRLGEAAIELERLVFRDSRPIEEAAPIVAAHHNLSQDDVLNLRIRLPLPRARPQLVELDGLEETMASRETIEAVTFEGESNLRVDRATALIRIVFEEMPAEDRRILRMHFLAGMTVAEVSRALHLDQKVLYRRIKKCLRAVRERLELAGIGPEYAEDLIQRISDEFVAPLRIEDLCPSPPDRDAAGGKGASG